MFKLFAFNLFLTTANATCGTFTNSSFADMHDGDVKIVTVTTDTITIFQSEPVAWSITAPLNTNDCTATIDFSKSKKPAHPPVPLRISLHQTSVGTMLIEFTDPSGTLNKDINYPLNIWTTEKELSAKDKCATMLTNTPFQDMHDGDLKFARLNNGMLHLGQPGIWNITVPFNEKLCTAVVDFSKTAKPQQPPVPLQVSVSVSFGNGQKSKDTVIMTWTDPSGTLNKDINYPLNVWEDVKDRINMNNVISLKTVNDINSLQSGCTKNACPFSFTNPHNVHGGRCGEVDASDRMPNDLWKNTERVHEYVEATIKWYRLSGLTGSLQQSPCYHADRIQRGSENVSWTGNGDLMRYTCDTVCSCNYPFCPDEPDVPRNQQYCSLCGPKFNAPILVKFWYPKTNEWN